MPIFLQNKNYLTILANRLELRQHRAQREKIPMPPVDAPLNEEEAKAFDILSKQIIEKSTLPSAEAEALLQSCISKYGKKVILNFYIDKPPTDKLSLAWPPFILIAVMVYFFLPDYNKAVSTCALLLILARVPYNKWLKQRHLATCESRRRENLQKLLSGEMKI